MTVLKIGEVAERLATTVRTIRYYEEEGLLRPDRTEKGTRLYAEHHIDRLQAILHLADNGFSLEAIGAIAHARQTCTTGDQGSHRVAEMINRAISGIDAKIDELKALRTDLRACAKRVAACRGCSNVPTSTGCPQCPLNSALKQSEMLNLIWE